MKKKYWPEKLNKQDRLDILNLMLTEGTKTGICMFINNYIDCDGMIYTFISTNFPHFITYKDKINPFFRPFWFETHRQRIQAINEQIKLIENEKK